MLINFAQVLFNYDGGELVTSEELKCPHCKEVITQEGEIITLARVVRRALNDPKLNESTSAEDKVERAVLTCRLVQHEELDIESEDIALIKSLVGKLYLPVVVMQAFALLEGKPNPLLEQH